MNGLMMDFPLTLSAVFRRAESIFRRQEIVWRNADRSISRYTCADFAGRARRLAQVLIDLGLRPGDRVATLGWNHAPHLEAYFGIPLMAGVLHTLNIRLHPDEPPTSSTTPATARSWSTKACCRCGAGEAEGQRPDRIVVGARPVAGGYLNTSR
jgi:acyl-CoA synthetase (AMP-forming)/AMP-acid ligase II